MTPLLWRHSGLPRVRDVLAWLFVAALLWAGAVHFLGLGDGER